MISLNIPGVTIVRALPNGDLCAIYEGTLDGERVIVKVSSDKANNDLVQTDARMLRRLCPPTAPDTGRFRYLSRCLTSGMTGDRAYNVLALALDHGVKEGGPEYVSLAEVLGAFPSGLDYRDVVWMWKRALVALGWAHNKSNIIHGNVTPPHILVHPLGHGAKLIDWSYSVVLKAEDVAKVPHVKKPGDRPTAWQRLLDDEDEAQVILEDEPQSPSHIKAITPAYGVYYPPEVMAKKTPTPATDIYMLGKCVTALLGGNTTTNWVPTEVPRQLREVLTQMVEEDPTKRYQHAWDIHDRLDAVLKQLVGDPVYRPLVMPK